LACPLTDERKRWLVGGSAAAGTAEAAGSSPRATHIDAGAPRFRVGGVLTELFHYRGRPLDHLPRRDRIGNLSGQDVDRAGHCYRSSLARSSYSFWSASSGLRVSGSMSSSSLRSGSGASSIGRPSCCSGGSRGRWRSSSPSTWRARAITPDGSPASAATWMPYERSAPPGTTRCRKST